MLYWFYRSMDRIFDPLPQEIKQKRDKTSAMLYYQTQDEGYKRYKHRCYRYLVLKAALFFGFGLVLGFLAKLL